MELKKAIILGIKVNPLDYPEVVQIIRQFVDDSQPHYVVTVNPEMIMTAQKDAEFREILNKADLSVADGVGLILASKIGDRAIRSRVTGTDLVEKLAAVGEEVGWRFFFLGGKGGSGRKAAQFLQAKYPKLEVAGSFEGDGSAAGDHETVAAVKKAGRVDILLVAYGHAKQEKWINRNLHSSGAKVAIGVGGAFNYLSGHSSRPPQFVQRMGLEWLYRLITEPWRLQRQLALPKFIWLVVKEKF